MELAHQHLFLLEQTKTQKHQNRKSNNQYFTPEFAVEKALSLIPNSKIENIIDPAVGNGIFLKIAQRKWEKVKLFGVDIDGKIIEELEKFNFQNANFFCGNALLQETWQNGKLQNIISNGRFDIVVGNPPFSSWFHRIAIPQILLNYKLAHRNGKLMRSQAIEILFLEIFIGLCKYNGFVIIVLPEGILSNPQYKYIREFILKETEVKYIISLPRNVFEETSAKTSILILQKSKKDNSNYFVNISHLEKSGNINNTIKIRATDLINRMDHSYYHNFGKNSVRELIEKGIEFKPLKDLIIYCKTGKTLYGKDRKFSDKGLRFLHATNITEIGINYKKDKKFIDKSSKMYFPNAYAKVEDILFVRVGVGCAGRVAIVNSKDDEGIATDYIHIFRVKGINPYFLVVYLKTKFGKDSIKLLKHGVGTVSINKTDLLSLPIPLVPEIIQVETEKRYKSILAECRRSEKADTLLNKMSSLIYYLEEEINNLEGGKYVEMRNMS
ncbi:MAG: N-6 DNA methylase [Candidatus Stahlbacteria bacterium]|nr:N-6 DNA methylase [Candidatus Stahlbacteria bacterium]